MTTTKKQPKRMDGYIRVSRVLGREGESFISTKVQREQIEQWAKLRGVEVAAWHEDLDQSGGKLDRPGLETLLERIGTGQTDGVIVAKLDRLSRLGVQDALKLVEQITDTGGSLAAIDLGIDPATPFGEFGMTIMLAMARMERRRLSESWEVAKTRAVDRGVHIGPTPYGYRRQRNEGGDAVKGMSLVRDERTAPIVEELYRVAAEQGLGAASNYLKQADPERTGEANHIARMLKRRVYLGEISHGDQVVREKAHDALVDPITWERAQAQQLSRRRTAEPFPLSGLATCAQCGNTLVGGRGGRAKDGRGIRSYRCRASLSSWPGERCTAPTTVVAHLLEGYVTDAMQEPLSRFTLRKVYSESAGGDVEGAREALEAAEQALNRFAGEIDLRESMGERAWRTAMDAHIATCDERRAAFREMAQSSGIEVDGEYLDFPGTTLFDLTEPGERRWFYEMMIERCAIQRGRTPLRDRIDLELRVLPDKGGSQILKTITAQPDAFLALHHLQQAADAA